MSNMTRLEILLCLLETKEVSVGEIVRVLGIPQSTVSNQLKLLKLGVLVKAHRKGTNVFYSLQDDHVAGILKMLSDHVREAKDA